MRRGLLCPWLKDRCTKVSRIIQDPVGVCSVFHRGVPHIICPVRLLGGKEVFNDLANRIFGDTRNYYTVKETRLGRLGRIDFVIARIEGVEEHKSEDLSEGYPNLIIKRLREVRGSHVKK